MVSDVQFIYQFYFISRSTSSQAILGEGVLRLLLPLIISEWKWDNIAMDYVMGLPRMTRGYDAIWVIVDRLTKSAYFLPIKNIYPLNRFARIYIKEIVKLHSVPASIVSDRDPRFTSHWALS